MLYVLTLSEQIPGADGEITYRAENEVAAYIMDLPNDMGIVNGVDLVEQNLRAIGVNPAGYRSFLRPVCRSFLKLSPATLANH